jgi:uncharacterized membrane protein
MGHRWGTGRIEAFSDGVFAIAITLLVLEISIPESGHDHMWRAIVHEWPAYLAYATSFTTIGAIWLIHHGIFRRLEYANDRVMRLNLLLLMAVAFLPFPTKLIGEAVRDRPAERASVVFYGATLFATSLLLSALWGSIARDRRLLKPEVTDREVNELLLVTAPSMGLYLVALAVAIISPISAAFLFLVIAAVAVLRAPADRETAPPAAGSA